MFKKNYTPRLTSGGRWAGLGWFVVPQWNIVLGASAKVGTCTLKKFMQVEGIECNYIPHNLVAKSSLPNIYFVVRDPVSRFQSLWRNKCRDGHGGKFSPSTRYPTWRTLHKASPETLMDFIEDGNTDAHWMNQSKVLSGLPANLIPLEYLDEWWETQGFGDLRSCKSNVSVKDDTEFSDELIERIKVFYADDVSLYNKAIDK